MILNDSSWHTLPAKSLDWLWINIFSFIVTTIDILVSYLHLKLCMNTHEIKKKPMKVQNKSHVFFFNSSISTNLYKAKCWWLAIVCFNFTAEQKQNCCSPMWERHFEPFIGPTCQRACWQNKKKIVFLLWLRQPRLFICQSTSFFALQYYIFVCVCVCMYCTAYHKIYIQHVYRIS